MADLAFAKTVLDASEIGDKDSYLAVSPYVDYALAAVWIVPSITKLVKDTSKKSNYTSLARALAGDFANMLTPIVWSQGDPETRLIALAVTDGMFMFSAVLGATTGKMMWDEK